MVGTKLATVSFDTTVSLEDRGDYWAARIDPVCMFAYADTADGARQRAREMMDFWLKNTPDIRPYLDSHQIPYTVNYAEEDEEPGMVRLTYSTPVKAVGNTLE